MGMLETITRFFQEGGSFMLPIAIVLALGLAITFERYWFLSLVKIKNRQVFKQIEPMLASQKFESLQNMLSNNSSTMSRVIGAGLARLNVSPRREDIEYAMEEGLMEVVPRLEKRTQYLATLANISTLLGLLGTIIGLIAAFSAVADADPSEKASLLSASISVAMNTTAFGLIAAIPLLGFHALLQTKTTEIVDSIEMASVKCLNTLISIQNLQPKTRSSDN